MFIKSQDKRLLLKIRQSPLRGSAMSVLTKQKDKCGDKVSKAVDKVLRQIFGDVATLIIYKHLENHYSLKQDDIVEKIEVFTKGLEELLKSGAFVIETRILEDIYSSFDLTQTLEFKARGNQHDFVSQMKLLRAT